MSDRKRYAELDFVDQFHYVHWRELPAGTVMVPPRVWYPDPQPTPGNPTIEVDKEWFEWAMAL